jgi:hypothetical protein
MLNKSIEWGELIQNQESFILDCSEMSREQMIFTGTIVSQGIKNYFLYARPKFYLPCSIFIDEFQNFVNENMYSLLAESRKYKISFCMATQSFATFNDRMVRSMLNVGNIVAFKLAYRDASLISRELGMAPEDLQNLEKFHCAFLTPKSSGIAKAPSPPYFRERTPPEKVEPQRSSKKPSWFTLEPLESYPKAESQ